MSYKLYNTEGLIIKREDLGESDKIISVFTKNFGRIELLAKGVRKIGSKLRQHLNLLDYSRFCFVVGKNYARLTDAEKILSWQNLSVPEDAASFVKLESAVKITYFLDRMLKGQEKNGDMWNFVMDALSYLDSEVNDEKSAIFLEKIVFLRILFFLGYAGLDKIPKSFVTDDLSKNLLSESVLFSNNITGAITKGIKASQM